MSETTPSEPAAEVTQPEAAQEPVVMEPGAPVTLPTITPAETIKALWPQVINAWLGSSIANSPVARSTEALNHLVSALPALRQALMEIV